MLIEKIKNDLDNARKDKNTENIAFLSTLYSEVYMIGKNKGNKMTTDEESVAVIKKFISNATETADARKKRGEDASKELIEIEMLKAYLPQQLSSEELNKVINSIVELLPEKSPKMMGKVMAELKQKYNGQYDGKLASDLVKKALV